MLYFFFILFSIPFLNAEQKITSHTLAIGKERLDYIAIVDSGPISSVSYIKKNPEENRPIAFAFNGGPGSSSVWLHIGGFGPRRLLSPEEGQAILPPYRIVDNQETLLDLADLVFIDPSGTGFSEEDNEAYSVAADIEAVSCFIRDYLTTYQRWNCPKYIAGESYGALRAAGVADCLQSRFGIYLNGLIFISPAINYQTFIFNQENPFPYFLFLPTYATTGWYHKAAHFGAKLEDVAQLARDFIYETYAPYLLFPKPDKKNFLYEKLSEMTGIPLEIIQKNQGQITDMTFLSHFFPDSNKIVGRFDTRITGYSEGNFEDPSSFQIEGIFSAGLHEYMHKELEFPHSYTIFSPEVNEAWNYRNYNGWGYPNLVGGLRNALISNPSLKIFGGCGYFDLATPFATAEYCFSTLNIPDASIQIDYYEGGHMYYLNPSARIKFKQDLTRFFQGE